MERHSQRRAGIVVLILVCQSLAHLWAQGQTVTATLGGTVRDPQDAAVAQAKVTLANPKTGFTRESLSRADGSYVFTLIPPGTYEVRVEKEGFSTYLHPDIVLAVAQSSTLNPTLDLGPIGLVLEVTAAAPVLNTGSANIGSEVTSEQVVELPLNIRNVYNLVQLSSAVNNSTETQGLT